MGKGFPPPSPKCTKKLSKVCLEYKPTVPMGVLVAIACRTFVAWRKLLRKGVSSTSKLDTQRAFNINRATVVGPFTKLQGALVHNEVPPDFERFASLPRRRGDRGIRTKHT